MATPFLSTANSFLSSSSCSFSSSSSLTIAPVKFQTQKNNTKRQLIYCKALNQESQLILTKRSLSICFMSSFVFSLANSSSNAAILEADDDEELLEKVKRDRKKRIERQTVLNSSNKEKECSLQAEQSGPSDRKNDLSTANSVLGGSIDSDWVQNANLAFSKLSSSPEEKTQVDTFNSSLASLISSITGNDIESSKTAFVSSATAFEKWTNLTGLVAQLKGL